MSVLSPGTTGMIGRTPGPFLYEREGRFFASCGPGLPELAAEELAALGATETEIGPLGVSFGATREVLCRAILGARFVQRILAPLASFRCGTREDLYKRAAAVDWPRLLTPENTFAVSATGRHPRLKHTGHAALVVKDALVDTMRERVGQRPDVDAKFPEVALHLHLTPNDATLSLDLTPEPLSHRGYRVKSVEAPLGECLAAAMVRWSAWDATRTLFDPMCGSGTLLAESLLVAGRVPPGYLREQAPRLPGLSPQVFAAERARIEQQARPVAAGLIRGADVDPNAIRSTRENLRRVPNGERVGLDVLRFEDHPGLENGVILVNPPWGLRLGEEEEARARLKAFGDWLKHRCKGSVAIVLLGHKDLVGAVGLKPRWRKPIIFSGQDARIAAFEMF